MSEPIRVLIADDMSKKAVEILSGAGFQVDVKTGMKPEELAAVIGQYHGVGIRSASKIKADTLANPGKPEDHRPRRHRRRQHRRQGRLREGHPRHQHAGGQRGGRRRAGASG